MNNYLHQFYWHDAPFPPKKDMPARLDANKEQQFTENAQFFLAKVQNP